MSVFSTRIISLSKVSGLLGLLFVAVSSSGQTGIAPFPGGGNPPMPPNTLSAPDFADVVGHFTSPMPSITVISFEAPFPGGGNPPMPPSALVASTFEAPNAGRRQPADAAECARSINF